MTGGAYGNDADDQLDVRHYFAILNRRKWTILAAVLLLAAYAGFTSLRQTPMYQSTAELLLQPRSTESVFDPSIIQTVADGEDAPTEMRVVRSRPVRDLVFEAIGAAPGVSVSNPKDSDFLLISATDADPVRAAEVANAYAEAYAEYRRSQAVSDLERARDELRIQIDELQAQAEQAVAEGRDPLAFRQQQDLFETREAQLRLAITQKTGGVQIVTPAVPTANQVSPDPVRSVTTAAILGLLVGIGLAFVREALDDSLKSLEDVERSAPRLPVLGAIPRIDQWKEHSSAYLVTEEAPLSPPAEAYRALRTSVQFLGVERPLKVIQVTSPGAGEGKSTAVANLAVTLAEAGRKVVVVDCDLRRPRVHEFFGASGEVGLTTLLLASGDPSTAFHQVEPNLMLLASGPVPPNPSELLAGARIAHILEILKSRFDVVLLDCPPILPVTDAAVLAPRADGTLLIVRAGRTRRRHLVRAVHLLEQMQAPLLGVAVNHVKTDTPSDYGYGYGYDRTRREPSKSQDDEQSEPAAAR